ncbi:MAG: M14 family zinc carboxypeptidase [Bacteroidota bacterium]
MKTTVLNLHQLQRFARIAFTIVALMVTTGICFSQTTKYSRVKVYTGKDGLAKLSQLGIAVDHGEVKKGVFFISDFSYKEIELIKSNGFKYDVLIDDVVEHYQRQNDTSTTPDLTPDGGEGEPTNKKSSKKKRFSDGCSSGVDYPVPDNFTLGSMGGYFTYQEMLDHLDSMAYKFPTIITVRQQIGTNTTIEGRPIYWVKISDNPSINEPEPEVLYTALHHAREPASISQMIFYMYYLLENYATDDEVTNLVDNTEMYFIPCINPDGYIYNWTTNPSGGGMWRKNRRNNGDGTFGVDLNRNYGYMWGYDNDGSSPNTNDETYRGTGPFSEPETDIIREFCESHEILITLNYHTYSNMLIYPWGYEQSIFTPDSAIFFSYARLMTRDNDYIFGTGDQTVGYVTNGDTDDWMYGEQFTKNKIISMTPEAGPDNYGFWPPSSAIIDLCKDNMWQNLAAAHLVGKYSIVEDLSPSIFNQQNDYFNFKIQRLGLDSPATFTVEIQPLGTEITSVGSPKSYPFLTLLEEMYDSISFSLDTSIQNGQQFSFVLAVDNGLFTYTDTITNTYGQISTILTDNCNTMTNWTSTSGWGVSNSIYYTSSGSITDSPSGNYSNSSSTSITLSTPIDLTDALTARLSYWARWEIELGYDYAQVLASADGGSTWTPLCGKYTTTGNSNQDQGKPLYDGFQTSWVLEEIDLDDYAGQSILIKFRIVSDLYLREDGFYFDDFEVNIVQNIPMILSIFSTDATCSGNDGSATVIVTDGIPPYSYQWDDPSNQTSATATGLTAGIYLVSVTDNMGYTQTDTVLINNIDAASLTAVTSDVSCYGDNDGAINLTVSGGTSPFTYNWSNGDTTQNITGLAPGTYDITVTDSSGCVSITGATVIQPDLISLLTDVSNVSCFGENDGSATVTTSGGTMPYSYLWSTGETTQNVTELVADTYTITVTDSKECISIDSATITQPGSISLSVNVTDDSSSIGNGAIDLTVTGGTPPYTFSWSNSATSEDLDSITGGTYIVVIEDSLGCTVTDSFEVADIIGIYDPVSCFLFIQIPTPVYSL